MERGIQVSVGPRDRGRTILFIAIWIVIGAIVLRLVLLPQMPCLSRDGVRFCEYARQVRESGLAALRDPAFQQHPLHPLAVLAAQAALRAAGRPDSPATWQSAAQIASILATSLLLAMLALFAAWCAAGLRLRRFAFSAAALAAAIGAILPLHVGLSLDGMSDPLHAGLFLAGLCCIAARPSLFSAGGAGLLSGLAFLTRPEGGAVLAVGLVSRILDRRDRRRSARVVHPLVMILAFAAVAGPYFAWIGGLSPKVDKQTVEEFLPQARGVVSEAQVAAAARQSVGWSAAPLHALYETTRAGRVVIVIAALPALWISRRRLRNPAIRALWLAGAIDVALLSALVARHGYLDPRHTLIAIELLIVMAAISLAVMHGSLRGTAGPFWAALVIVIAPLAAYSLRVPNAADTQIPAAAEALRSASGDRKPRVLAASSARRVGFYADVTVVPWNAYLPTVDARFEDVRGYLLDPDPAARPEFLVLETGPGEHHAGAGELLARLKADPIVGPLLTHEQTFPGERGVVAHVLRIARPTEQVPSPP